MCMFAVIFLIQYFQLFRVAAKLEKAEKHGKKVLLKKSGKFRKTFGIFSKFTENQGKFRELFMVRIIFSEVIC